MVSERVDRRELGGRGEIYHYLTTLTTPLHAPFKYLPSADKQWLQFDLGPPTLVTGLVTKGRGDRKRRHWVTSYKLSYSNDSSSWSYYKDAAHLDPKVSDTHNSS